MPAVSISSNAEENNRTPKTKKARTGSTRSPSVDSVNGQVPTRADAQKDTSKRARESGVEENIVSPPRKRMTASSGTPARTREPEGAVEETVPPPKRARAPARNAGFNTFLNNHRDPKKELPATNTRIPLKDAPTSAGRWHIPDSDYAEFLRLYNQQVLAYNQVDRLTEMHRTDGLGPILIDFDFKYPPSTEERWFGDEELVDIVDVILDELSMAYEMEETTKFSVFVFQKANIVPSADYVKDGVHMLITVQSDKVAQRVLRQQIIPRLESQFAYMELMTKWDKIYDEGMSDGGAPWPLYGSRKPDAEQAYLLTRQFNVTVSESQDSLEREETDAFTKAGFLNDNLHLLSARNTRDLAVLQRTVRFTNQCVLMIQADDEKQRMALLEQSASSNLSGPNLTPFSFNIDRMISLLLACQSLEEIQFHYDEFMSACEIDDHQLCEVSKYVMMLGPDYYDAGSYKNRSYICWLLRSISEKLLVTWVRFMFRRDNPDFGRMTEWIDMWNKCTARKKSTRTVAIRIMRSIVKKINFEAAAAIEAECVDHYLMATIQSVQTSSQPGRGNSKHIMGCTDSDLAKLAFHLFGEEFVCVNLQGMGLWYHFVDHYWQPIEEGTTLRRYLTDRLRPLYANKIAQLMAEMGSMASDDPRQKYLNSRLLTIVDIVANLGNASPKDKIMKECKHLFFDKEFLKKLDSKISYHLLCMKNGVVDLNTGEFRPGKPDDYISMCTDQNYLVDISSPECQNIVKEIELYMSQMFPIPEVCENMYRILASVLHGDVTMNQRMYYLHGGGQNGKGIFTEQLLPSLFGSYFGTLKRNFFLSEDESVGGTNTEVADLPGKRCTVTSEFTEGSAICSAPFKQLTAGTDEMKARRLYSPNYVKFFPQNVAFICSNYFIDIISQDHGIWRRIAVVGCVSMFTDTPDADKPFQFKRENISEKMENWYEVFLHMLIKIVIQTKAKVSLCKTIEADTKKYRSSQDEFAQFVYDNIVVDESGVLGMVELNRRFREWFDDVKGTKFKGKIDKLHKYIEKMYEIPMQDMRNQWTGVRLKFFEENYSTANTDCAFDSPRPTSRAPEAMPPALIFQAPGKRDSFDDEAAQSQSTNATPDSTAVKRKRATPAAIKIVKRKASGELEEPGTKFAKQ